MGNTFTFHVFSYAEPDGTGTEPQEAASKMHGAMNNTFTFHVFSYAEPDGTGTEPQEALGKYTTHQTGPDGTGTGTGPVPQKL